MEKMELKHRPTFIANYLTPAIQGGFVTPLYPNNCRVGQGHYCPFPPSEPYVKVSNHTAQAVLNFYLIETSS